MFTVGSVHDHEIQHNAGEEKISNQCLFHKQQQEEKKIKKKEKKERKKKRRKQEHLSLAQAIGKSRGVGGIEWV